MKQEQTTLIAITGGSGSGKSWITAQLLLMLGARACHISLDSFYCDRSSIASEERCKINFDHPDAIDWELFEAVLRDAAAGRTTRLPAYDFKTHCRLDAWDAFCPAPIVLVDGLWLLLNPSIHSQFDLSIYMDCPLGVRRQRRLERDTIERGRSIGPESQYFDHVVIPMHAQYVAQQLRDADIVLFYPHLQSDVRFLYDEIVEVAMARNGGSELVKRIPVVEEPTRSLSAITRKPRLVEERT